MKTPRHVAMTPPANGDGANGAGENGVGVTATTPRMEPRDTDPVTEARVEIVGGDVSAPANRQGNRILPPVEHRFKPGQSGNPNGRPKGIVSKALTKELRRKIGSDETVLKAYVRKYVDEAIKECDAARFNSIRDTVDGRPTVADDQSGNTSVKIEIVMVGGQ